MGYLFALGPAWRLLCMDNGMVYCSDDDPGHDEDMGESDEN